MTRHHPAHAARRAWEATLLAALRLLLTFLVLAVALGSVALAVGCASVAPAAFVAIDRVEDGRIAVAVDDDGRAFDVPLAALPAGTTEGTVLRVQRAGAFAWATARIDSAERARILATYPRSR